MSTEYAMKCSECGGDCTRDSVDVGVGVLHGPWGCSDCGWSEDPQYSHPTAESGFDPQGGYDPVVAAAARGDKAFFERWRGAGHGRGAGDDL